MPISDDAERILAEADPGVWPTTRLMSSRNVKPEELMHAVLSDHLHALIWVNKMLGFEAGQHDTHDPMLEAVAVLKAKADAYDRLTAGADDGDHTGGGPVG